jgi:hypothetical protein
MNIQSRANIYKENKTFCFLSVYFFERLPKVIKIFMVCKQNFDNIIQKIMCRVSTSRHFLYGSTDIEIVNVNIGFIETSKIYWII